MARSIAARAGALASATTAIAVVGLYVVAPGWRDAIVEEDRGIETLTAVVSLLAFIVAVVAIARLPRRPHPVALALVPATALLFVLDEVSFGQRLFGWSPPRLYGKEIDSVHDLLPAALRLRHHPWVLISCAPAAVALL